MGLKERYQEKVEAQLKEWKVKLDELATRAQKLEAATREKIEPLLAKVREDYKFAEARLQALKSSGIGVWKRLRTGLDFALGQLRKSFRKASSQAKKED